MTDTTAHDRALEEYWPHVEGRERVRFAGSVYFRGGDRCWIWLGGLESDGGYSRFRSETLGVIAGHRWSLIAHRGPLAKPVVRHRCDVRCCVRPDHLVDGTQAQNVADTVRRGSWTSYAHSGPRQWPALAHALREAARRGDEELIADLLRRPTQLEMWPDR